MKKKMSSLSICKEQVKEVKMKKKKIIIIFMVIKWKFAKHFDLNCLFPVQWSERYPWLTFFSFASIFTKVESNSKKIVVVLIAEDFSFFETRSNAVNQNHWPLALSHPVKNEFHSFLLAFFFFSCFLSLFLLFLLLLYGMFEQCTCPLDLRHENRKSQYVCSVHCWFWTRNATNEHMSFHLSFLLSILFAFSMYFILVFPFFSIWYQFSDTIFQTIDEGEIPISILIWSGLSPWHQTQLQNVSKITKAAPMLLLNEFFFYLLFLSTEYNDFYWFDLSFLFISFQFSVFLFRYEINAHIICPKISLNEKKQKTKKNSKKKSQK